MIEGNFKPNLMIIKRMSLCKCFLFSQNKCHAVMLKLGPQINIINTFKIIF